MRQAVKSFLMRVRLYDRISPFIVLPMRQRVLNWLVQWLIYRTRGLGFSPHFTSRVIHGENLVLGRGVWFYLAINGVVIGDGTMIAGGVKIISANHECDDFHKHAKCDPIRIGKRCWLAANCVVLPGVQLGDDVIVGAGAVVTRSFPSGSVIGGVPAKVIRSVTGNA
jgi:acetyltransferase-like isoleucine patch superfamily enzyme